MKKCVYDYQNICTCAEDDKCGCDFDNNMTRGVSCEIEEKNTSTDKKTQAKQK